MIGLAKVTEELAEFETDRKTLERKNSKQTDGKPKDRDKQIDDNARAIKMMQGRINIIYNYFMQQQQKGGAVLHYKTEQSDNSDPVSFVLNQSDYVVDR